jgi:hypothetical protein
MGEILSIFIYWCLWVVKRTDNLGDNMKRRKQMNKPFYLVLALAMFIFGASIFGCDPDEPSENPEATNRNSASVDNVDGKEDVEIIEAESYSPGTCEGYTGREQWMSYALNFWESQCPEGWKWDTAGLCYQDCSDDGNWRDDGLYCNDLRSHISHAKRQCTPRGRAASFLIRVRKKQYRESAKNIEWPGLYNRIRPKSWWDKM